MNDKKTNKIQLTQEGLAELRQELDKLLTVDLPKVVERVSIARDHGDLSENSEYKSARDDKDIIDSRISQIEAILSKAEVVEKTNCDQSVGIGSVVTVYQKDKPKVKYTYTLVGEFESNLETGKVSSVSPIGKALMHSSKGDEVLVKAPVGEITYVVESIR